MNIKTWPVALIVALILTGAAEASTLYTDFGPGQTYNTGAAYGIKGSDPFREAVAAAFKPSVTGTLDSIDLAVQLISSFGTPTFTGELTSDASGVPGVIIESFILDSLPVDPTIRTVSSILHPSLSSLSNYWVVVLPGDTTTFGGWKASIFFANTQVTDRSVDGGSTWSTDPGGGAPAFDVIGTSVPEPTTWVLFAGPLAGMLWFRRRRA